jgi:hypothetical protein
MTEHEKGPHTTPAVYNLYAVSVRACSFARGVLPARGSQAHAQVRLGRTTLADWVAATVSDCTLASCVYGVGRTDAQGGARHGVCQEPRERPLEQL